MIVTKGYQSRLRAMIDELCELEEGLTPWEVEFVDGAARSRFRYTRSQALTIEKIHRRRILGEDE